MLEIELKALKPLPKSLVSRVYTVTAAGADTRLAFEVFLSVALFLITEIIFFQYPTFSDSKILRQDFLI